ncbi:MAG: trk system potassium uptake protein TrkH [Planctomycetota bacterium]|jgi:trk system potassium uptake protein TrkH
MNFRAVLWLLGCVLLLLAGFMLAPAVVAAWFGERAAFEGCLMAALVTGLVGGIAAFATRGKTQTKDGHIDYFRREGLAAVGLAWLLSGVFGSLPFLFSGAMNTVPDAIFEAVSGFTTTGSTILTGADIDALDKGIAFWRSFTHWLGGIGIVLVFVLLFPTGGRSLFRSEVPGVSREAVQQRVRDSAFGLVRIYVGLTVIQVVLLYFTDERIGLYESVLHSFGTLATGGFSNHSSSVAWFGSWKVELVIVGFMFLAGINFGIYDVFLRSGWKRGWRMLCSSFEVRVYASIVLGATICIALVLWFWGGSNGNDPTGELPNYSSFLLSLRDSAFAVVSLQTSTGYATANFDLWPDFCRFLLLLLAMCGACAGSTGGGIKVIRIVILVKAAMRGVSRFARPRAIHSVRIDGQTVGDKTVGMVMAYVGLWVVVFVLSTLLLTAMSIEPPAPYEDQVLLISATGVLATLNNIGPGLAALGPYENFAFMPAGAKILFSFLMVLGRLEFYAIVVLFVPRFWRS